MNPIKPNIGTLDRYLRLSAGLIIFASGITGRRSTLSRSILTTLGAAKIAEGITGWCPLVALTGTSTPTPEPVTTGQNAGPAKNAGNAGNVQHPRNVQHSRNGGNGGTVENAGNLGRRGNSQQQSSVQKSESTGTITSLHESKPLHSQARTAQAELTSGSHSTDSVQTNRDSEHRIDAGQTNRDSVDRRQDSLKESSKTNTKERQSKSEQGDEARID